MIQQFTTHQLSEDTVKNTRSRGWLARPSFAQCSLVGLILAAVWLLVSVLAASGASPAAAAGPGAGLPDGMLYPITIFNDGSTGDISVAFLSATQFVVVYRDNNNSYYGTAVVGEYANGWVSFGPEYVFNMGNSQHSSVAALSGSSFVVAYRDHGNAGHGTAVVGAVSGNTISFSSEYVFNTAETYFTAVAKLTSTRFVVAYQDAGDSSKGKALIGEYSAGAISYGSEYIFNNAGTGSVSVAVMIASSDKFVTAYRDNGNSGFGTAVVGTVIGNTITYGTEYVFNSAGTGELSIMSLDSNKVFIVYRNQGVSNRATSNVGTLSGAAISYSINYVLNNAASSFYHAFAVARLPYNHILVGYVNDADGDGRITTPSESGGIISFGDTISYNPGSSSDPPAVASYLYDFIVCWNDASDGNKGKCRYNGDYFTFLPLVAK
jgi:hypothetical protein